MNLLRRALLASIGAMIGWKPSSAKETSPDSGEETTTQTAADGSSVTPRHVLCFLGKDRDLSPLSDAASQAIRDFASGFSVDEDYSQAERDDRMSQSFAVCWDRVEADAWSPADEDAVVDHQSVLYVLGPSMPQAETVKVSMLALRLVERLIGAGAVAVKGESAGIAHGLDRWSELIRQGAEALKAADPLAQQRIGRLAFAKRPLSATGYLESVGFHLVGLPEVYVPETAGSERQIVAIMDAVADEIARRGLEPTLRDRRASLSFDSTYEVDEFKFNPYGIVRLPK
ncbi:hypothetical protein ELH80_26620 (plasmid) [Rhizobium ruizarguesonis]|uniref:hypothetical protein n=1 Tax=Rhizobium ruizarguesonis TaxID=2081791 RepID=UPI0010307410|nr:hypothetical protein [Rhizobium ruizarguesonis]TBY83564.1 hypothetical protein E0H40_31250 [Rhizobium leguminosarum bv. viciae]NEH28707.1 hypothetical protein [Rhizobium ruizarguesonis]NEH62615.1 hypothetical protein [Rhizobium ruizarguesonis]NEI77576.1 hypothetical protein [Rhizobium ruizarguesonis]TAW60080.1 hypothetical protein ELI15_26805 [Rhizobium ruizarguesonis]